MIPHTNDVILRRTWRTRRRIRPAVRQHLVLPRDVFKAAMGQTCTHHPCLSISGMHTLCICCWSALVTCYTQLRTVLWRTHTKWNVGRLEQLAPMHFECSRSLLRSDVQLDMSMLLAVTPAELPLAATIVDHHIRRSAGSHRSLPRNQGRAPSASLARAEASGWRGRRPTRAGHWLPTAPASPMSRDPPISHRWPTSRGSS